MTTTARVGLKSNENWLTFSISFQDASHLALAWYQKDRFFNNGFSG
jgi:hypothetical protein